jgi:ribosomal-protein-alanine N-acetyltransferase
MKSQKAPPRLRLPIESPRVHLRAPEPGDGPAIARWFRDRRVTLPIGQPSDYSIRDARKYVRRTKQARKDGSGYGLSVLLRENGKLIGGCGIDKIVLDHRKAHIGYWIAPPYWGNGYASEAASALIAAGRRELGLHRFHTGVLPKNLRSIRVLRRLGFQIEGRARGEYLIDGRYQDSVLFGLVGREFRPFRLRRHTPQMIPQL